MKIKNILIIAVLCISAINIINAEFSTPEFYGAVTPAHETGSRLYKINDTHILNMYCSDTVRIFGKVGVIENSDISWKSAAQLTSNTFGSMRPHASAMLSDNQFIVFYGNATPTPNIEACIGTIINNEITYTSPTTIDSSYYYDSMEVKILYDSTFVLVFSRMGSDAYSIIGSVAGTTITVGTPYLTGAHNRYVGVDRIDDSHFVVAFDDSDNSRYGTAKIGTVTGTTISFGSNYIFNNAETTYISTDIINDVYIVNYIDTGSLTYVTSRMGVISGSTISFGAEYDFSTGATGTDISLIDETSFIISFINAPHIKFVNGNISGTSISYNIPLIGNTYTYGTYFPKVISLNLYSYTSIYTLWGSGVNDGYGILWENYPPIPIDYDTHTNHTAKFDELFSVLTVWSFITIIFGTYEFYNGATLFWLILIMIPYTMMWIKQGSVIIPATMALLSGSILFTLVPAESMAPIKILLTVGIAGIFYHIIKSR